MTTWLAQVVAGLPGSERELVDRYTERLLALARRQLPLRLRRRVDPDDIVQSVYRSFFRRLKGHQLQLDESHDLWRLLAAITYYKIFNSVKYHQRQCRDLRREIALSEGDHPLEDLGCTDRQNLDVLYDSLAQLLEKLPESARTIVVRRLEGLTIEAIAADINRSRRTVLRVLANVQDLASQMVENVP